MKARLSRLARALSLATFVLASSIPVWADGIQGQGRAVARLLFDPHGAVIAGCLTKSAGSPSLDAQALLAARGLHPQVNKLEGVPTPGFVRVSVDLASATSSQVGVDTNDADDVIQCTPLMFPDVPDAARAVVRGWAMSFSPDADKTFRIRSSKLHWPVDAHSELVRLDLVMHVLVDKNGAVADRKMIGADRYATFDALLDEHLAMVRFPPGHERRWELLTVRMNPRYPWNAIYPAGRDLMPSIQSQVHRIYADDAYDLPEHLPWPAQVDGTHYSASVTMQLSLDENGTILSSVLLESSGQDSFDRAAGSVLSGLHFAKAAAPHTEAHTVEFWPVSQ